MESNLNKVLLITQARYGSSRLPGKVLESIGDETILSLHLKRLKKSKGCDYFVVATTNEPESAEIEKVAFENGFDVYKGSLDDVLDRFYQIVVQRDVEFVVRVTSDCPLVDPSIVDLIIETIATDKTLTYVHTSNDFPDGFDVEVFRSSELLEAWRQAKKRSEREHVTPYIRNKAIQRGTYKEYQAVTQKYKDIRLTVDELVDLTAIRVLLQNIDKYEAWNIFSEFVLQNHNLFLNQAILRNEGYFKSLNND